MITAPHPSATRPDDAPSKPDRPRAARGKLAELLADPRQLWVVHYACQSLDLDEREGSPRVTAIGLRNVETGDVTSFSIAAEAERARLGPVQVLSRMDSLERQVLDGFYRFVAKHGGMRFAHWNMRDEVFGFPALEHRLQILGGAPIAIPGGLRHDLAALFSELYGPSFAPPPRLQSLARLNGLPTTGFLTGKEEADAFERGQYGAVKRSTLVKVKILYDLLQFAHDGVLVTAGATDARAATVASGARKGRTHVFISHATVDQREAAVIVRQLEAGGIRCWIAPRDIALGSDYQAAILQAIQTMDAMIVVVSDAANQSRHVAKEVNLADEEKKPLYPLCLGKSAPDGALRYALSARQRFEAGADLAGAVTLLQRYL
jgi:hypothetical protein